jgi:hypothetical protein
MDDPNVPPLKTHLLTRSSQPCRLRQQRLAEAYQAVCPEIRLPLPDTSMPQSLDKRKRPTAALAAAGA